MQGKELVLISAEEVKKYGWETEDGVAYVLMLNDTQHIDLFHVDNIWTYQLTEEPTFPEEEAAIFTGRNVTYMYELLDLYYGLTGMCLG